MKGFLVAFGLIACAAALPTAEYFVEIGANGERICRENCGRPFVGQCQPIPCPGTPPALARDCGKPSCLTNDAWWLLWPHPENEYQFLQCRGMGVWEPIARDCSCGTLFDYDKQRCVHPHEYTPQCPKHPATPRPLPCPEGCGNECDPTTESPVVTDKPTTQPPVTQPPVTNPPTGGCPCVCVPCIAWPCSPCPTNCCRSFGYEEIVQDN